MKINMMSEQRFIQNAIHFLVGATQASPDANRDATYRSIIMLLSKLHEEIEPDGVDSLYGEQPQEDLFNGQPDQMQQHIENLPGIQQDRVRAMGDPGKLQAVQNKIQDMMNYYQNKGGQQ